MLNGTVESDHDAVRAECIDKSLKAEDVQVDEHARDAGISEEFEDIVLSFEDLKLATNDFSYKSVFQRCEGEIYYMGVLPNFPFAIAVKLFAENEEFQNEIRLLRLCRHGNVLRLLGERSMEGKNMLILENISKGTLEDILYAVPLTNISWESRLDIALDVATGLSYLHDEVGMRNRIHIVHRNLKPSTIFLTGDAAKIGGLAFSRLLMNSNPSTEPMDSGHMHLPTGRPIVVRGTAGYISPELMELGLLSTGADVYSFGVVILELITRIRPEALHIEDLRSSAGDDYDFSKIIDSTLVPNFECIRESIAMLVDVGLRCTERNRLDRPTMKEVVARIETIIKRRKFLPLVDRQLCGHFAKLPENAHRGIEQTTDLMNYNIHINFDGSQRFHSHRHPIRSFILKVYGKAVSYCQGRGAILGKAEQVTRLLNGVDRTAYIARTETSFISETGAEMELGQENLARLIREGSRSSDLRNGMVELRNGTEVVDSNLAWREAPRTSGTEKEMVSVLLRCGGAWEGLGIDISDLEMRDFIFGLFRESGFDEWNERRFTFSFPWNGVFRMDGLFRMNLYIKKEKMIIKLNIILIQPIFSDEDYEAFMGQYHLRLSIFRNKWQYQADEPFKKLYPLRNLRNHPKIHEPFRKLYPLRNLRNHPKIDEPFRNKDEVWNIETKIYRFIDMCF